MTPAQKALFWRLWSEACSAQGWMANERESQRKAMLARCGFDSLTHVDRGPGFDRVRAECLRLSDRLEGGMESAFPRVGEMRRHLHLVEKLRTELEAMGIAADAYIGRLSSDRGWSGDWRALARDPERGPDRMRHLLMTLSRAVRQLRKERTHEAPQPICQE